MQYMPEPPKIYGQRFLGVLACSDKIPNSMYMVCECDKSDHCICIRNRSYGSTIMWLHAFQFCVAFTYSLTDLYTYITQIDIFYSQFRVQANAQTNQTVQINRTVYGYGILALEWLMLMRNKIR